jgi:hypothetical protein
MQFDTLALRRESQDSLSALLLIHSLE